MEGRRHLPAGAKKREAGPWQGGAGARRCRAVQSGDADVVDRGAGSTACSSGGILLPLTVLLLLLLAVLFLLLVVLLLLGPFSSALSVLVAGDGGRNELGALRFAAAAGFCRSSARVWRARLGPDAEGSDGMRAQRQGHAAASVGHGAGACACGGQKRG